MFIFVRNCQTVFESSCTILHPLQQWIRVPVFPHPCQQLLSVFYILVLLIDVVSLSHHCVNSLSIYIYKSIYISIYICIYIYAYIYGYKLFLLKAVVLFQIVMKGIQVKAMHRDAQPHIQMLLTYKAVLME